MGGMAARLHSVHGCLKIIQWHGLQIEWGVAGSTDPDIWKAQSLPYHFQLHGEQTAVVLAQHTAAVADQFPLHNHSSGKVFSLSSWACCSLQELLKALANALADLCDSPSSAPVLEDALQELLQEAPPFLQKGNGLQQQPADLVKRRCEVSQTKPTPSLPPARPEAQEGPPTDGSDILENSIRQGIQEVESGLRTIRQALQALGPRGSPPQVSGMSSGLLWDPAAVLGSQGPSNTSDTDERTPAQERALRVTRNDLERVVIELQDLLVPLGYPRRPLQAGATPPVQTSRRALVELGLS